VVFVLFDRAAYETYAAALRTRASR